MDWTEAARDNGWNVEEHGGLFRLTCMQKGCSGSVEIAPGDPIPEPCKERHTHTWQEMRAYRKIVARLRSRRRQIGLSQDDVSAALGMADGYINKLESFAKNASLPTLALWAETLGFSVSFQPTEFPPATKRALDSRKANPYDEARARFSHDK